ncbi:MAG: potassium-transporting ATPase subunit KdpA, partial [Alphaproteobacteria bacterium]|nr:potassium-transporting ATPase subunit KdpA [Alphaproteobacteria bacterium]
MTLIGGLQIGFIFILLLALTKPLGLYLYNVYEKPFPFLYLRRFEDIIFRLCGIKKEGQDWKAYTTSLVLFNVIGIFVVFLIQIFQHYLPLNPQKLPAVPWDLALNTAISFVTHTNWQAYSGETTMSYFTQMVGLTWQNFCAAGTGIAAFLALARGLAHHSVDEADCRIGNFWIDLIRSILYVFLPGCFIFSLLLVSQGALQNFSSTLDVITLEGAKQSIAMGPVASQEAIKILGTNGGGFFNANSAHPFENPTPFSNFLQIICLVLIPAALTYTYGKMTQNSQHGWSLLATMVILSIIGVTFIYYFESQSNPLLSHLPLSQGMGNLEGKEIRFGIVGTSLFANFATDTSGGPANAMYDSFSPLGGMILLINMLIGEVIFGGV